MIKQKLLTALNTNGEEYYESFGKHPERTHLFCVQAKKVNVPSKTNKGKYNYCYVALAHLLKIGEDLIWVDSANHSSTVIGSVCIMEIYDNILKTQPILIEDRNGHYLHGKKVLDTDIKDIVKYIHGINKLQIGLADVDYDANR